MSPTGASKSINLYKMSNSSAYCIHSNFKTNVVASGPILYVLYGNCQKLSWHRDDATQCPTVQFVRASVLLITIIVNQISHRKKGSTLLYFLYTCQICFKCFQVFCTTNKYKMNKKVQIRVQKVFFLSKICQNHIQKSMYKMLKSCTKSHVQNVHFMLSLIHI